MPTSVSAARYPRYLLRLLLVPQSSWGTPDHGLDDHLAPVVADIKRDGHLALLVLPAYHLFEEVADGRTVHALLRRGDSTKSNDTLPDLMMVRNSSSSISPLPFLSIAFMSVCMSSLFSANPSANNGSSSSSAEMLPPESLSRYLKYSRSCFSSSSWKSIYCFFPCFSSHSRSSRPI